MTDPVIPFPAELAVATAETARRWAAAPPDPATARLTAVRDAPGGRAFLRESVDGVLRPESLVTAAAGLRRVANRVPEALSWSQRGALRFGGAIAPVLPAPPVPLARRLLRDLVRPLLLDGRPARLGAAIARAEALPARLSLRPRGPRVLGDRGAAQHRDALREAARRPDVREVRTVVADLVGPRAPWAFEETVAEAIDLLRPLLRDLTEHGARLVLDVTSAADLDLTVAVLTRLLEEPALQGVDAGISLPTALPESFPALRELLTGAAYQAEHGSRPLLVRLLASPRLGDDAAQAALHAWKPAAYGTPLDAAANHLRCLSAALQPEFAAAVRVRSAGSGLIEAAAAHVLGGARGVPVEIELPLGHPVAAAIAVELAQGAPGAGDDGAARESAQETTVPEVPDRGGAVADGAAARSRSRLVLSAPVILPGGGEAAAEEILARLLDAPLPVTDAEVSAVIERTAEASLRRTPRRTQNRLLPVHESVVGPAFLRTPASDADLTQAVLGIASHTEGTATGGFVDTAVYAVREEADADFGAPGFRNAAESDPALPANREWMREVLAAVPASTAGAGVAALLATEAEVDAVLGRIREDAAAWGAQPAADRAEILLRTAAILEERRGALIETAIAESGLLFAEADDAVTRAVDHARYYAAKARELDAIPGARFVPERVSVVDVACSPIDGPAEAVLAVLAAGSGAVLIAGADDAAGGSGPRPRPAGSRSAAQVAEALWQAGAPRGLLPVVEIAAGETALLSYLCTHPSVDRLLTDRSRRAAERVRAERPALPMLAAPGGPGSLVVTASADLDLAIADLVQSAFSHAGRDPRGAALAILVDPVGRSARFAGQLADAVRSLRVADGSTAEAQVGPLARAASAPQRTALLELAADESWLVRPEPRDTAQQDGAETEEGSARLWSPGVRVGIQPGSPGHLARSAVPVLRVLHAPTLAQAILLQNAAGGVAGLHTRDPEELALWLRGVTAGDLFVNRATTRTRVQRQPSGGWSPDVPGPAMKAGGPNRLIGLGSWRPTGSAASSTLHLRGLDSRITALIEEAQPSLDYESFERLRRGALSDAVAWDREFGRVRDVSRLGVERNLFRYRPVPVEIRVAGSAPLGELLRVVIAAVRAGSRFTLSVSDGLPAAVRRVIGDLRSTVFVETPEEWLARRSAATGDQEQAIEIPRADRIRLIGSDAPVAHRALAEAIGGDPAVVVYDGEVTTAGRIELLPFVREQSIAITAHRDGLRDDWSATVI